MTTDQTPNRPHDDQPLDPWMVELARDLDQDVVVPRELMWARIRKTRASRAESQRKSRILRQRLMGVAAIAATLVIGVAIGRYSKVTSLSAGDAARTVAASPLSSDSQVVLDQKASPVNVAMSEHLARTETLLARYRSDDSSARPTPDVVEWSSDLLTTTRLLLDLPELRDVRTRRLLQDLELVLVQIIQSRGASAPEVRRAPRETMRETNLLTRVRAAASTASISNGSTLGGISE